jgi:hypothetical protein
MRFSRLILLILWIATPACARGAGDVFIDPSEDFRADVYASPRTALRVLARDVAGTLCDCDSFEPDTSHVVIVNDLEGAIAGAMRQMHSDVHLRASADAIESPKAGDFVVRVALTDPPRPAAMWGSADVRSGTLTATITGAAVKPLTVSVKFVDKPWADDWSAFINREPAKHKWILAASPRPCISEQEADVYARNAAAQALWPSVRDQMHDNAIGKKVIKVTQDFVVQQIQASLNRDLGVADQFVQRFDRPYGRVWKKSLLIDATPATIDKLARNISLAARQDLARRTSENWRTWGSTGGLVGVILLLYFFVNAVTKGYFVWRLRAVALLLAIVGLLTVLAMR